MSETPIGEVFASMQTTFPQPTGSAYSVEEHMFNQDEIQKRHPQQPTDQQRSEAVTALKKLLVAKGYAPGEYAREILRRLIEWIEANADQSAAIAERDAMIAELQSRVRELEESSDGPARIGPSDEDKYGTPTTEK